MSDTTSMSADREEFEVWAVKEGHRVDKDGAGDYIKLPAYWSWLAWQAAQAAMPVHKSRGLTSQKRGIQLLVASMLGEGKS